ncbi:unnamed protein product [Aphanomyces euteiches]|uniref:Uncharacterized protein n=1 Tax=Aphanomyces euteiches TaxID=100861 RepID=A0A6G0WQC6_9STRA|nr:hypothetical protein Ae201684_012846 [Aphanomyces euteiches]KAH9097652.1 hypothetical protein Ae201684P_001128 [Aphanomyces euteiches]
MTLTSALESIVGQDGVTGVVWNDAQGLLLGSQGDFQGVRSGFGALNVLISRAQALGPDDSTPILRLETTKRRVVVQKQSDGTVLAVSTSKDVDAIDSKE